VYFVLFPKGTDNIVWTPHQLCGVFFSFFHLRTKRYSVSDKLRIVENIY